MNNFDLERKILSFIFWTAFLKIVGSSAAPAPQPPSGLIVTALCDSCSPAQLRVQWEALPKSDGITAYEINYSGEEFDTDLRSANASGNVNFTALVHLEEFVVYDVRIRAYSQGGPSPFSPYRSARTYAG